MSRIYTRTGDDGETGLFGGGRVPKSHLRVAAYGAVDELNAALGWVLARLPEAETSIRERLTVVQGDLFAIGADLATPADARSRSHIPPLPEDRPGEFEQWMDEAEEELTPLKTFILPGGSEAGAALHLARTVCRRAEREVVRLSMESAISEAVLVYLNRLSDLLFELARLANHRAGSAETPWKP